MTDKIVHSIRTFNRFYTDMIGLLNNHILNTRYSLPEARIMYEVHQNKDCNAKDIRSVLHIDKGQLSRILKKLEKEKIISKRRSEEDGRAIHLALTAKGQEEFQKLDNASYLQIANLLSSVPEDKKEDLVHHMQEIMRIMRQNEH